MTANSNFREFVRIRKQLRSNNTCYNSDLECTGSLSATAVSRCSCNLRGAHIHRGCALALLVKYSRSRWAVDNCHTSAIIKCIGIKRDLSIRGSTGDLVVYVRWAGDCWCLGINCKDKHGNNIKVWLSYKKMNIPHGSSWSAKSDDYIQLKLKIPYLQ